MPSGRVERTAVAVVRVTSRGATVAPSVASTRRARWRSSPRSRSWESCLRSSLAGVGAEGDRGPVVDDQVDAPRLGEEGGSGGVEEGLEQGGERNPFVVGESP